MNALKHWRESRHALFLEFIRDIPLEATILDVGGTPEFWLGRIPAGWKLTILNIIPQTPLGNETVVEGSGCRLPFPSKSFDLVFSNSAIAFVGEWRKQKQMAFEIQRVGKRYFVQTPNKDFFLDWRTYVPFFHFLSPAHQAWVHSRMGVGRYPKALDWRDAWVQATRVRDLNRREVAALFPRGKILNEKALGLTKSFIIHS
jgi:hypothetical protein